MLLLQKVAHIHSYMRARAESLKKYARRRCFNHLATFHEVKSNFSLFTRLLVQPARGD